jgi:HEPN domain-containing protein
MKKDNIKNSTDMFFYKANIDLNTSKYLLKGFETGELEIDFELIFFHLQQSAEKFLKALLSYNKIRVYKTHDIEDLIELLDDNNITTIPHINLLERLTQYAVEGRYAIIHDDLDDTDKYIILLEDLSNYILEKIKAKE